MVYSNLQASTVNVEIKQEQNQNVRVGAFGEHRSVPLIVAIGATVFSFVIGGLPALFCSVGAIYLAYTVRKLLCNIGVRAKSYLPAILADLIYIYSSL